MIYDTTLPDGSHTVSDSSQSIIPATGIDDIRTPRTLRDSVEEALHNYFQHLEGQDVTDVYNMVLSEVEAPLLEEVWQEYQDQGVSFLGVNTYDQPATALSFARDNNVTYPSVIDVNDGKVKLAFAQVTPIQATPTTLVVDKEGRVAARIIGQLQSASILSTLVRDALGELP